MAWELRRFSPARTTQQSWVEHAVANKDNPFHAMTLAWRYRLLALCLAIGVEVCLFVAWENQGGIKGPESPLSWSQYPGLVIVMVFGGFLPNLLVPVLFFLGQIFCLYTAILLVLAFSRWLSWRAAHP